MIEPILKFLLELIKLFYYKKVYKHKLNTDIDIERDNNEKIDINSKIYYPPFQSSNSWNLKPHSLKQISEYGCYFLSLIFIIINIKNLRLKTKKELDTYEISLIYKGLNSKYISKNNSFMLNPQGIIKEFGENYFLNFNGLKEDIKEYPKNNILITQYDYKDYSHFVVCNHKGKLIYDPLENSLVRSKGKPVSVRRIEIINNTPLVNEFNKLFDNKN